LSLVAQIFTLSPHPFFFLRVRRLRTYAFPLHFPTPLLGVERNLFSLPLLFFQCVSNGLLPMTRKRWQFRFFFEPFFLLSPDFPHRGRQNAPALFQSLPFLFPLRLLSAKGLSVRNLFFFSYDEKGPSSDLSFWSFFCWPTPLPASTEAPPPPVASLF